MSWATRYLKEKKLHQVYLLGDRFVDSTWELKRDAEMRVRALNLKDEELRIKNIPYRDKKKLTTEAQLRIAERRPKVEQMLDDGVSMREIARRLKVSFTTVQMDKRCIYEQRKAMG